MRPCGALLIGVAVVLGAAVGPALAQVLQAPSQGRPITFRDNGQQVDRLAPTPPYAALASGLYGRQIVQAPSQDGGYTVQVWSLLVSPKSTTGEAKLAGAAVLMLIAGRVQVTAGEQRSELVPGATVPVREGAGLRIVNADSRPAQLRAVVVTGTR